MITIEPVQYEDLQGMKALYEDAFGGITEFDKMTATFFSRIKK